MDLVGVADGVESKGSYFRGGYTFCLVLSAAQVSKSCILDVHAGDLAAYPHPLFVLVCRPSLETEVGRGEGPEGWTRGGVVLYFLRTGVALDVYGTAVKSVSESQVRGTPELE